MRLEPWAAASLQLIHSPIVVVELYSVVAVVVVGLLVLADTAAAADS